MPAAIFIYFYSLGKTYTLYRELECVRAGCRARYRVEPNDVIPTFVASVLPLPPPPPINSSLTSSLFAIALSLRSIVLRRDTTR